MRRCDTEATPSPKQSKAHYVVTVVPRFSILVMKLKESWKSQVRCKKNDALFK